MNLKKTIYYFEHALEKEKEYLKLCERDIAKIEEILRELKGGIK